MGTPEYERAIVTFFDILGFRDLIASRSALEIAAILDDLGRFADVGDDGYTSTDDLEALGFSDSIIRVRRPDKPSNAAFPTGLLFHELLDLVHAQVNLIYKGVLVRGGLTIGNVFATRSRVFGPAFVDAYELESAVARFPRIAVAPAVLRQLENDRTLVAKHHDVAQEQGYVSQLVRQGDDGVWFVDYLFAAEREGDEPAQYIEFLGKHRDLIAAGLAGEQRLSSKVQKFAWLARYHNSRISSLSAEALDEYGIDVPDLLVDEREFAPLYRFTQDVVDRVARDDA